MDDVRKEISAWVGVDMWGFDPTLVIALSDDQHRAFGRALISCVNADGTIAPAERDWIIGYGVVGGAPDHVLAELRQYGGEIPVEELIDATPIMRQAARMVIYDAIRACSADGDLSDAERAMIARMANRLGMGEDDVVQLINAYVEEKQAKSRRIQLIFPSGSPQPPT